MLPIHSSIDKIIHITTTVIKSTDIARKYPRLRKITSCEKRMHAIT